MELNNSIVVYIQVFSEYSGKIYYSMSTGTCEQLKSRSQSAVSQGFAP